MQKHVRRSRRSKIWGQWRLGRRRRRRLEINNCYFEYVSELDTEDGSLQIWISSPTSKPTQALKLATDMTVWCRILRGQQWQYTGRSSCVYGVWIPKVWMLRALCTLVSEARDSACSIGNCSDKLVTCMNSPGVAAIDIPTDVIYIFIAKSVCILSLPL
jgi:hypothetical protein